MTEDKQARDAVEQARTPEKRGDHPAAGPHAKAHLIDDSKTPGTGALPDGKPGDIDAGPD